MLKKKSTNNTKINSKILLNKEGKETRGLVSKKALRRKNLIFGRAQAQTPSEKYRKHQF